VSFALGTSHIAFAAVDVVESKSRPGRDDSILSFLQRRTFIGCLVALISTRRRLWFRQRRRPRWIGRHLRVIDKAARDASQGEIFDARPKRDDALYGRSWPTARTAHNRTKVTITEPASSANATQGTQTRLPSLVNVPNPEMKAARRSKSVPLTLCEVSGRPVRGFVRSLDRRRATQVRSNEMAPLGVASRDHLVDCQEPSLEPALR